MASSTAEPSTPRRENAAPAPITPAGLLPDRPPIAALFLIEFDVKAGYTIVWKQATPGLDLSGAVEYKSLPSGLHAVSEDLIYFVHEEASNGDAGSTSSTPPSDTTGYAGLSAFVNLPTEEAGARNARMIAVGVLVRRSYGRLGRAWRHAAALMDMARQLAADSTQVPLLEAYWLKNGSTGAASAASPVADERPLLQITDSPLGSPAVPVPPPMGYRPQPSLAVPKHSRSRSVSDGTALLLPPGHRLSPHHPAWSLTTLLDTFGPLIFPIYRAALLRKRILISTHAPVRETNNFVYNISVLANVPNSALDLVEPSAVAHQRIRPLFTIGVNDITFLMDDLAASKRATRDTAEAGGATLLDNSKPAYTGPGWIACTTDSILAMKSDLWDVLITMPPPASAHQASPMKPSPSSSSSARTAGVKDSKSEKIWPTVEIAKGVPLKATQRDLRRYKALVAGLERLAGRSESLSSQADAQLTDASESIVEPTTWAALAYHGFMWWASAGEQSRSGETDETIHDAQLLADIAPPRPQVAPSDNPQSPSANANLLDSVTSLTAGRAPADEMDGSNDNGTDEDDNEGEERARLELAIITYFHRLTTQILSVLSDIVEGSDDDEYEEDAYYDDDDGEGAYYEDDYDDNDDATNAVRGSGEGDGIVGQSSRSSDDDDLVDARRSGLSGAASSSTALLLRRRGGRTSSSSSARRHRNNNANNNNNNNRSHARLYPQPSTHTLRVDSDAVSRMGLDVWSQADAAFVRDIAQQYFSVGSGLRSQRAVHVESKGIEVCGLKIC
ncbi:hypothetical protein HMPREF1624_06563 [Sporothrix schenckii ATCC 58251]|uniref:DUF4484 domain-containing protein n=1 Tax=Sporothrix schenckii (strain ATCC 58251 / de Perez 2211183) TaxID=1391915 RepID=U7PNR7_SPOS1|nr:hypothetical protein HMPREF1624_06563 [Sporothrix schenckii ATCC 58251]